MKHVEKGFTLKGITIGDIVDGSMVVGIDGDEETLRWDVAVLRDEQTNGASLKESGDYYTTYGLKEYEDSENIKWLSSEDYN